MKCPFCMNPLNDGATVCGHCGAYERKRAPLGFVQGGSCALFLAGLLVAWYFGYMRNLKLALLVSGGAFVVFCAWFVVLKRLGWKPPAKVWIHERGVRSSNPTA